MRLWTRLTERAFEIGEKLNVSLIPLIEMYNSTCQVKNLDYHTTRYGPKTSVNVCPTCRGMANILLVDCRVQVITYMGCSYLLVDLRRFTNLEST